MAHELTQNYMKIMANQTPYDWRKLVDVNIADEALRTQVEKLLDIIALSPTGRKVFEKIDQKQHHYTLERLQLVSVLKESGYVAVDNIIGISLQDTIVKQTIIAGQEIFQPVAPRLEATIAAHATGTPEHEQAVANHRKIYSDNHLILTLMHELVHASDERLDPDDRRCTFDLATRFQNDPILKKSLPKDIAGYPQNNVSSSDFLGAVFQYKQALIAKGTDQEKEAYTKHALANQRLFEQYAVDVTNNFVDEINIVLQKRGLQPLQKRGDYNIDTLDPAPYHDGPEGTRDAEIIQAFVDIMHGRDGCNPFLAAITPCPHITPTSPPSRKGKQR